MFEDLLILLECNTYLLKKISLFRFHFACFVVTGHFTVCNLH